jgi:hypothetical protein
MPSPVKENQSINQSSFTATLFAQPNYCESGDAVPNLSKSHSKLWMIRAI